MPRTIELERRGSKSLVMWDKVSSVEFVVCSNYNASMPVGSQWDWGHYFPSVVEAARYFDKNT